MFTYRIGLHAGTKEMTPFTHAFRAWSRASETAVSNLIEANRATVAAFTPGEDALESPAVEPSVPSIVGTDRGWDSSRTVSDPAAISVGDRVTFSKAITDADVRDFAAASGDTNRLHLDDSFAGETRFGERIAHGTLVSGLISAALARTPGVTVYLSQDLAFHGPVSIGDHLTATVEVVEVLGGDRYRLETTVVAEGTTVVAGEAVVLIDALPDAVDEKQV